MTGRSAPATVPESWLASWLQTPNGLRILTMSLVTPQRETWRFKQRGMHSFARGMNPVYWALILRVAQDEGQWMPSTWAERGLNK
jgi:hypothetical protein